MHFLRRFSPRLLLLLLCIRGANILAQTEESRPRIDVQTTDFDLVDQEREGRVVPIRVYHKDSKSPKPLVLFSHGLGGSRTNNSYLGEYWANHGYISVFMQHAGSDIDVIQNAGFGQRLRVLKSAASYESASARLRDVSFVLDSLERFENESNHPLNGKIDLQHIGLSGHSFGAVTTLSMAGRKAPIGPPVKEPRIDAFVAMSPQPGKSRNPKPAFAGLDRPFFSLTGSQDRSPIDSSITPEKRMQVYEYLPAGNKYHLVLEGAEHHAFGDSTSRFRTTKRDPAHHGIIQQLTTRFWDAHLKEEKAAQDWLQSNQVRSTDGFKRSDIWTWK